MIYSILRLYAQWRS